MAIPDLGTLAEHLEDKLVPVCLANGPLAAFMIGNAKEIFHTSNPGHAQLLVCVPPPLEVGPRVGPLPLVPVALRRSRRPLSLRRLRRRLSAGCVLLWVAFFALRRPLCGARA